MLCLISKREFGNTKQQKTSYEDIEVCEGEVQQKPIILCWIQKFHGWPDHKRLRKNGSSKTTLKYLVYLTPLGVSPKQTLKN